MKKAIIAIGVVIIIVLLVFLNVRFKKRSRVGVEVTEVRRRVVEKIVTGSGSIRPKRQVNVSASAIGKITKVVVKEGDYVEKGDFLLQIDPTEYKSIVEQLKAGIRAAEAALSMEKANLRKAEYDYERAEKLYKKGFLSEEELRNTKIGMEINRSRVKSARESLFQQQANLKKALHDLKEVRITAEMAGVITSMNVEEGENAIMGTLNNPGTVLLTIADLSEMEAEVEVDETEVVYVEVGQEASVKLDAYPDSSFAGVVSEVGNSAIRPRVGAGEESVDFKVVVSIKDSISGIRPGLSASADIKVAEAKDAISIPIQCLTVRRESELSKAGASRQSGEAQGEQMGGDGDDDEDLDKEIEGVFVVKDGVARFRKVEVGIAGEKYFTVRSGLEEGEKVVSGPFRVINDLKNGDLVKVKGKTSTSDK